jgi:dipeptidyl aminopeptidase/acylaminoacyl peptidase
VYYAITHPKLLHLAAAVVADSWTAGYSRYLIDASEQSLAALADYETATGGSFWERKAEWLENETTFNVDRVRTPVLFTMHGSDIHRDSLSLAEIGAFRRNKKPIEYIYIPDGNHYLIRPRQYLAEMEVVVEWMSFWLQNRNPTDPELAARWKVLRSQQDEVLKQPERPRVRWVPVPIEEATRRE